MPRPKLVNIPPKPAPVRSKEAPDTVVVLKPVEGRFVPCAFTLPAPPDPERGDVAEAAPLRSAVALRSEELLFCDATICCMVNDSPFDTIAASNGLFIPERGVDAEAAGVSAEDRERMVSEYRVIQKGSKM